MLPTSKPSLNDRAIRIPHRVQLEKPFGGCGSEEGGYSCGAAVRAVLAVTETWVSAGFDRLRLVKLRLMSALRYSLWSDITSKPARSGFIQGFNTSTKTALEARINTAGGNHFSRQMLVKMLFP